MFCRKAAIKFIIKLSVIYSCAVEREIQPKKKSSEVIKKESLAWTIETVDEVDYSELNDEVKNAKEKKMV